jgi:hypothetical protein
MKTITLVETRKGCQCCEKESRYHVMFRGSFYGELYYNLKGYVGYLPAPREIGDVPIPFNIGETSISNYKKTVAQLNKEWAQKV